MTAELEQAERLAQVSDLYFNQGQDQTAIAHRLHVSRSTVSRLLTLARREGIVEIRVHYPLPTSPGIAEALQERFGLKQALVLATADLSAADILPRVSLLSAKYLDAQLQDGDTLAMSWGNTLRQLVEAMAPARSRRVRVVQLMGTLHATFSEIDGANLARRMAQVLGGEYFNLNAPIIVENGETRRALLQEPSIRGVVELARRASIALVGIGGMTQNSSAVLRLGLVNGETLEAVKRHGAVGDICAQYFDVSGRVVTEELNRRVVGMDLCTLREIPQVVGVAVGPHKARAVLGALRGKFLNVLVTDDATAARILQLERARPRSGPRPREARMTRGQVASR